MSGGTHPNDSMNVLIRLSIMMFLQFFTWGAWFATLALALGSNGLGDYIGAAFESAPIAAIFAPLFLGLVADRFFPSQIVMGALMLLGGIIMCGVPYFAAQGAEGGQMMVWLMIAHMCCYMPTLGLSNTITFTNLPPNLYPKTRVWGTIGWITAGLGVGFAGWSDSLNILWLGAICSIILGVYCFTLPNTPPPAKGEPLNIRSLLMLDAMKLMKNPGFAVFAICSMLICIPLGYYYGQTSNFLGAAGFKEAGSTMTIGQMSEIFFMLLIPFFFRKLGVKLMLLIGMGCWVLRYALFAMGAPEQISWMLFVGVALHGICYDFFFVTGFMYTDNKAPKEIRGQAQGLLVFLTQGLGMFFGFRFAFGGTIPFTSIALPNTLTIKDATYGAAPSGTLVAEIKSATEGQSRDTLESLMAMFDKGYPESESITAALINQTGSEWQLYWVFPAILAGAVFVAFGLLFWDKMTPDADVDDVEEAVEKVPVETVP